MSTFWGWFQGLGVAIGGATIAFSANSAIAQITQDATLPNNSSVRQQGNIRFIEGGTRSGNNLFHSFGEFSVPTGTTAYFNNALDIQNIISRVTGKSISNIDGILRANGTANLFLINPNGIIFGSNASLNIGGSFVASTASSLNFADGTKFSATNPQTTPLLTVSVPIGLQFGATANPIRNQSQASPDGATTIYRNPIGIQVPFGKTLALVGGDLVLEGGNLTAEGGRIELGSVAGNSLVSLNPTNQGWVLGYEGVQNFQNIQLIQRTKVDGSKIPSIVDGSSNDGSSNIQVQGKSVEIIGDDVRLRTQTTGVRNGGNLTITTRKLIVRDGAQVLTTTTGKGDAGNLTVNASESVELSGNGKKYSTALVSETGAAGKAGDTTINTGRLRVQDGAQISAETSGIIQNLSTSSQFIPATGKGGNLTVNASESVELIGTSADGYPSGLFATTINSASAVNLTLSTGQLIVRDGATVSVNSQVAKYVIYPENARNLGKSGNLEVQARSIRLDNQGKLTAESDSSQGGNITLQVQDLLLLRRNSQISTNAGKVGAGGNGGNITINAPSGFIVAQPQENSDITANAFTGSGGRVQINATGIFGIVPRSREDLTRLLRTNEPTKLDPQQLATSDITAISKESPTLNGVVNINTPDVDPSRGLVNLPTEPSPPKLAQDCKAVAQNQSEFIITGRGGLPPNPREVLTSNPVYVDWVSLDDANTKLHSVVGTDTGTRGRRDRQEQSRRGEDAQKRNYVNSPTQIVEAQGWIIDSNGDVVLVATAPTVTPRSPWFRPVSCAASHSGE